MLTRFPKLFSPDLVTAAARLDEVVLLANRQRRRVHRVFALALFVSLLAFIPQLSQPGPVFAYLAQAWPAVFGSLFELAQQDMTTAELVGSMCVLGIFTAVCAWESFQLRERLEELETVDAGTSLFDALTRLEHESSLARAYLARVKQVRSLRVGDWQVCRALASPAEING
jgi:hypothetical protein